MKHLSILILLATLLTAKNEQLIIDAKNFEADEQKNISIFSGNVKIQMGQDKLNANKVEIFFTVDKKTNNKIPSKYEANGDVDFELISNTKHYLGKGDKVIYSPIKQEYTILGNAFLQEKNDDRKIYGDKIYVNQLNGEAKVSGSDENPVRFIINVQRGQQGENK